MDITLLIIGLVAVVVIFLWVTYNGLVKANVQVDGAWSDIVVQLKRRADLIPNLIESVKGYAAHEKQVFQDVTEARANVVNATAQGPKQTAAAENQFEAALKSLFAVAEAYPQLRASENFQQLQAELVDTEDKIQASRRYYNTGVTILNTKVQVFPANLFASMFGFRNRDFFEVEDRASLEKPVEVKF